MFFNAYFVPSFLLLILVSFLNWLGETHGFYLSFVWYDFMMHFLGGLWVGLCLMWMLYTPYLAKLQKLTTTRNILLGVFVVGIIWEIIELSLGFTHWVDKGYVFDTVHDLVMDVLGGYIAMVLSRVVTRTK